MVIHDWKAFVLFLILAVAQTVIATDSGLLAVWALPEEEAKRVRRAHHYVILAVSALAVLAVTIAIGVFADHNAFAAERRAETAEKRQGDMASRLERNEKVSANISDELSATGERGLTGTQVSEIRQELRFVRSADAIPRLTSVPNEQSEDDLHPLQPGLAGSIRPTAKASPVESRKLALRIDQTATAIREKAGSDVDRMEAVLHSVRVYDWNNKPEEAERKFYALKPEIMAQFDMQHKELASFFFQIQEERDDFAKIEQFTPGDLQIDRSQFEAALAADQATPPIPATWQGSGYLFKAPDTQVLLYLLALENRLR